MSLADDFEEVLIDEATLQACIDELARTIEADYRDAQPLLFLGVLKGAAPFMWDLAKRVDLPLEMDFMAVSSYGKSTRSSGVVRILKDLDQSVEGKHILVVEDIVDTGLTLNYILDNLRSRGPASLKLCALLVKERDRPVETPLDYVGFRIPDRFVVGYGLDAGERYRNLPYIAVLKQALCDQLTAHQPADPPTEG